MQQRGGAKLVVILAIIAGCGSPGTPSDPGGDAGAAQPQQDVAPDTVIVRWKAKPRPGARAALRVRGTIEDRDQDGVYDRFANIADGTLALIELDKDVAVSDALAQLRADPEILYAEPNHIVHAIATPNDAQFTQLYGLHNSGQTGGTADADIDAVEAWETSVGDSDIVVGVIDTGIDYTHPDLATNMWVNPNEIPGNGLDDDANGVIDDIHGYNAITGGGDPMDTHYHGTHCAGTIGAVGNNTIGVAGVNWQVSLMAIKFLNPSGTTADAIESVSYAIGQRNAGVNLRVLSNSWGGGGFSQGLLDAINAANNAGIIFVAAAGNSASNNDVSPHYPSSYDAPNVVAVAATDDDDALASFSCFGSTSVDLGAPGVSIVSTKPNNTYGALSGTSMATPHVSGVAALVLAHNDTLSVADLKAALLDSGDPIPALAGKTVTGKRLNAAAALELVGPPVPHFKLSASPPSITIDQEGSASYTIDLISVAGFTGDVSLAVTANPALNATMTVSPEVAAAPGSATLTVATTQATAPGIYELTITGSSGSLVKTRKVSLRVRPHGTVDVPFPSTDTPSAIGDYSTITSVIAIPPDQGMKIEEIVLDLDVTHTYIGDLVITLTSPQGTVATLHNRSGGSTDNIHQSFPLPNQFIGQQAAGDWVLTIVDHKFNDTGTLDGWTLHVIGVPEPAETTPPTATITAPADGSTVTGTIAVTADASDNVAVKRVELWLDGALLATDTTAPYSFSWNTRLVANGSHTLHAIARDQVGNSGQSASITVTTDNDLVPPDVAITSPEQGATVAGTVTVTATASDAVGVTRVDFYVDGSFAASATAAPYSFAWSTLASVDGNHALSARAYDAAGNTSASATVTVTTDNDHAPPSVAITAPSDGAIVAGSVTVTVTASDDVGVTRVELFVDGALYASDTSAPYSFTWSSSSVPNGSHALVAKARDAVGNLTASAPVTVTVDNDYVPPTVALTAPAEGATVTGTTTIAADAADDRGIQRVDFYINGQLEATDTAAPYDMAWDTLASGNGPHALTARAYDLQGNSTTSAAVNVSAANAGLASYDLVRKAPACATVHAFCDSGGLIDGRNGKGPERNAPNTLFASCIDGTGGGYHYDESLDRLKVVSLDGGPLRAGKTVRIEATVWNYGGDTLDLYYTTTPDAPSWTLITSIAGGSGNAAKTLTTTFTLPIADLVAIRGNFRYSSSPGTCTTGSYDDRDDLVFAIDNTPDTTPPTTAITSPANGSTISGQTTVTATASDDINVATVELYVDDVKVATATTAPYSFTWNAAGAANGEHVLATRAIDPSGNAGTSQPVTVTVENDVVAPAVAITSPAAGTSVRSTVTVTATASDNVAVASVELYVDGVLRGTDTTAPYAVAWSTTGLSTGAHTLTARALDTSGNATTSEPVTVLVDNASPTSTITSPAAGTRVRGTVTVTANASDNVGVIATELFVDNVKLATDTAAPYAFDWATSANGTRVLRVRALDAAGNITDSPSISVVVDNTAPATSITSPAAGAIVRGIVTVTATASDNFGVTAVELYAGDTLVATGTTSPYSLAWDTTAFADGSYPLRTRALDAAGNATYSATRDLIVDNTAPAVAITTPGHGAIVGATVAVAIAASDARGLARVELFVDGAYVGEDTAAPYSIPWTTGANGSHTLTSRATDAAGNVATGAAVIVTVANGIAAAAYDATLRAPSCSGYAAGCDTGTLIDGRDGKGPESNAPNTIHSSCADGTAGSYHVDESIDRLRVYTADGSPLAPGKTVTIEATIWARSNLVDSDALDLYATASPSSPSWTFIATLLPGNVNGTRVLTATYTLPAGGVQAIRANLRRRTLGGGSASPCTAGNYNDHDDLVFTAAPAN